MKKFITNTNTYLIERFPALWNTKVVWMLGASIIIHILFFLIGLLALSNPETLHSRGADDSFFDNGSIYFSIMISIVMLVVWLLHLFKNNAFKNFYPTSAFSLFKQFAIYFVIVLASTSFYYSYNIGTKTYITTKYDDATVSTEIEIANRSSTFFSQSLKSYTIDQLVYPEPFNQLYCESTSKYIDYDRVYYQFLDIDYQFYSLKQEEYVYKNSNYKLEKRFDYVYKENRDSTIVYYFKDKVVNVTDALITTEPSYYNYSKVFYSNRFSKYNSYDLYGSNNYQSYKEKDNKLKKHFSKLNKELLDKADANQIETLLQGFLDIADKYKVKHNLTGQEWLKLVYYPEDFKVKHIVQDEYRPYERYNYDVNNSKLSEIQKLHAKIETKKYIDTDSLKHSFENIDDIKNSTIFDYSVFVFLWIAFSLATLIFIFRVTGLRPLLFSIVTAVVLIIIVALLTSLIAYGSRGNDIEYFISYLTLSIGLCILFMAIFKTTDIRKSFSAIYINLSLAGIIPLILLIIGIITMHQEEACRDQYVTYDLRREHCINLFKYFGVYWNHILLVLGFIFMYLFSKVIMKWRAMPEG